MGRRKKKESIIRRIVLLFVVCVILPFLAAAFVIAIVFGNYTISNLGENMMDSVSVLGSQISQQAEKYEDESMLLYNNGYVEQIEHSDGLSDEMKERINLSLATTCLSDTAIHALYVVTDDFTYHAGMNYPYLESVMDPYKEEIIAGGGKCLWYPTNALLGSEKQNKYILARSLNSKSSKNVGILYMVLDDSMVTDAFRNMQTSQAVLYMVDQEGKILYTSEETRFNGILDMSSVDVHQRKAYLKTTIDDQKQILVYCHMMDLDWYVISVTPLGSLWRSISRMELPFTGIAVIYLLFLALMMRLLHRYVFVPLKVLKTNMDAYAQGDLEATSMEEIGVGEFRSLSRHFNRMTERIHGLMEAYKAEEDEKNRQKMKALTSQLTPHFIYNALNTIKWMAVLNHQDQIRSLTESLVNIFMNAAKVDDASYTLHDEMELIQNYAVIQKARFMNFDLVVEASEDSLSCSIRKFLVQPIVENAIVHGLMRGKIKNTKISVKAYTENEVLHILVHDDGVGFDVEAWRNHPNTESEHTNIGLHSVEEIIRLEYKEPYELQIESSPGEGTTMHYILPVRRVSGDQDNHSR